MGSRGPQPLPSNVHRLRGNPGHKSAFDLTDSVNPEIEIPNCPAHLLPEARKEWRRITPLLERLRLVSKIDRASLALYCQAWARMVWCEEQLKGAMETAAARRAEFEIRRAEFDARRAAVIERGEEWTGGEWTGGDGFMISTPNGSFTYSPYWVGANKAADQVHKFQALFGMSPSARGRVTPSTNQLPLPGIAPAEGFNAL